MEIFLLIFVISLLVGVLGSMLGIGGGVFLIPLLSVVMGLPIKTAIGASIVSVIATSSAAGAVYIGRGMTHSRLAMVLEIATTFGALAGGITAVLLKPNILAGIFAIVLLYVSYTMGKGYQGEREATPSGLLDTTYTDPLTGHLVSYGVHNLPAGMAASFFAGNISGLLGIGGGVIKVPVMNLIMKLPLRAAIATSNFMIGITAATSALIYYQHGYIDPTVAIPTALGILIGAQAGSRLGGRVRSARLKQIFRWIVLIFAVQMFIKAFTG
jgi:uncharacterized membrane protein YfcA